MKIGDKIRQRRKELKWSQRDLAAKMGYNHSTITRIETGKIDIPQSRILQFAEVLGVSVGYLMDWVDEETSKKNDVIVNIVMKVRKDEELLSMVDILTKLDPEKRKAVMPVLIALSTTDK